MKTEGGQAAEQMQKEILGKGTFLLRRRKYLEKKNKILVKRIFLFRKREILGKIQLFRKRKFLQKEHFFAEKGNT